MLISEKYAQTLRFMHCHPRWGRDGAKWAHIVRALITETGATSVLDYGCGKGMLKQVLAASCPSVRVVEYDPGVKGKDTAPTQRFDIVACTDVMEHVEPECVAAVLAHIRSLTTKRVLFVISLRLARALLPDGTNAHITLQSADWWLQALDAAGFGCNDFEVKQGKELVFIGQ